MNKASSISRTCTFGIVAAACCFVISGCIYDVAITATATRKVDARLLGNWTSKDEKNKLKVVKLDDSNYVVSCDGDLYRAYHSDMTPRLSACRNLNRINPSMLIGPGNCWTMAH